MTRYSAEFRCERAVHHGHEQNRRSRPHRPHVHPKTDDRLEHRSPCGKAAFSPRLRAEARGEAAGPAEIRFHQRMTRWRSLSATTST